MDLAFDGPALKIPEDTTLEVASVEDGSAARLELLQLNPPLLFSTVHRLQLMAV